VCRANVIGTVVPIAARTRALELTDDAGRALDAEFMATYKNDASALVEREGARLASLRKEALAAQAIIEHAHSYHAGYARALARRAFAISEELGCDFNAGFIMIPANERHTYAAAEVLAAYRAMEDATFCIEHLRIVRAYARVHANDKTADGILFDTRKDADWSAPIRSIRVYMTRNTSNELLHVVIDAPGIRDHCRPHVLLPRSAWNGFDVVYSCTDTAVSAVLGELRVNVEHTAPYDLFIAFEVVVRA